jgi:XTP/dITP diphosphohydrolase
VDALNGRPGVWSRRYAGPDASDDENNAKLLRELSAVSGTNRGAQFVCVLAIAQGDQIVAEFRGEARGVILASPRGSYGFGYDPLFLDPEFGKTFAEMSPQEKLQRSHRGKAMHAMMDWLGQRRK